MAEHNPIFTESEFATEEWRAVVGHEGWYEISNLGRLKRVHAGKGTYVGRIINVILNAHGYPKVVLSRYGIYTTREVHVLVAAAFLRPRSTKIFEHINHLDGDKTNSRASNLEYTTPRGNYLHAIATGLLPVDWSSRLRVNCPRGDAHYSRRDPTKVRRGSKQPNSKLTEAIVEAIFFAPGPHEPIGEMYGVSRGRVSAIKRGDAWKHLTERLRNKNS